LSPESRLPLRTELVKRFNVSVPTLQSAMNRLREDGFVESKGKLGTFVAKRPPFMSNYAFVFPFYPGASDWTGFWTAMVDEAQTIEKSGQLRGGKISQYFNITDGHPDNTTYQALLRDVREHRLAGLMFGSPPHLIEQTPLVQEAGIPRVWIAQDPSRFPTMWMVRIAAEMFRDKALDYLVARGRKRVAFLYNPGQFEGDHSPGNPLTLALEKRGMYSHEYWRQYISPGAPFGARNCVNLMMQHTNQERPDALVIGDDNLVNQAVAGLLMSGVRVGIDVDVVAHANFPLPGPSTELPLRRLGFDAKQIVARCVEAIDRQRAGEKEPQVLPVPAVWEDEITN